MILRIYPGLFYYIFLEISSVEKKINNGTNETCIMSIY